MAEPEPADTVVKARYASAGRVKESLLALAFLAPALAVFAAFFFYPIGRLVFLGLHQQNRTGTRQRWEGFGQFTDVLTSEDFLEGAWTTIKYVLLTVPPGLVLGILLALAVNKQMRGIKVFQGIFSSTIASSVAVASVIFFVLINPQVGVFKVDWLANPDWALFGVSLSSIWQNLGLTFIIVLAGLQAVPEEVMESATLDGVGPFRRFFSITLPLISPTLLFLVVVLTIFGFQAFAQIEILTNGGPARSTETLVFKIFRLGQEPVNLGTAAVMSIGLFVLTFLVSVFQFAILDRRVHYENAGRAR